MIRIFQRILNPGTRNKRFLILFVFSLCLNNSIFCQNKDVAIIQSLQYFVKTTEYLDESFFPAYTTDSIFLKDITNEINYWCKEKFGVKKIEYALPDSIKVKYGQFCTSWKNKKVKTPDNSISVFIRTTLKIGKITDSAFIYTFNTKVIVKDSQDHEKVVFSSKMPFITEFSDDITDQVEMGKTDFHNFYIDGIKAAFKEKDKVFKIRYIYKPQTNDYKEFLTDPKIFNIERVENHYMLYTDSLLPDLNLFFNQSILEIDQKLWLESLGPGQIKMFIYSHPAAKYGFTLSNKSNKINYTVKLKMDDYTSSIVYYKKKDIQFSINEGTTPVGKFNYSANDNLSGRLNNEMYFTKWSEIHGVTEIYKDSNLVALIKELDDYLWIYYKEPISDDQKADLFTLLFACDFGFAVRKQVISAYYYFH